MKLNFSRLRYVCLYVADVETSMRFYRDILGLVVESQAPGFVQLGTGTVKLALEPGGTGIHGVKDRGRNPYLLQFEAASYEELSEMTDHLQSCKVGLLSKLKATDYGIITAFIDPDGNKLELLYKGRHGSNVPPSALDG